MSLFSRLLDRVFNRPRIVPSEPTLGKNAPQQPGEPKVMTPQERQKLLDSIGTPEEAKFMEWQTVSSSWIDALRFNPIIPLAQMRVKKGGKVYSFGGMNFTTFKAWMSAASKGKFFTDHLIGRYTQWQDAPATGKGILSTKLKAIGFTGDQGKQAAALAGWGADAAAAHR